jgi:hypothetical protein
VLIETCARCAGEPRNNRGNQASGTPRVRPSDNSTQKLSSSNRTLLALTKELIPGPQDKVSAMGDKFKQFAQRFGVEAVIVRDNHLGKQPKSGVNPTFNTCT